MVCSVLALHQPDVHAAAISAAPLDDNSVAPLLALDGAMESLAARVTPAIVNVAVTATPEEQANNGGDPDANNQMPGGLPPGFSQFFGNGERRRHFSTSATAAAGARSGQRRDYFAGRLHRNQQPCGSREQRDIKVTLNDRRILTGKVIGVDKLTDIAVIKVNAHDLPFVSWGDSSSLHPGQTVLAFGSPFGSLQFSVTRGIVSAVNRPNPFRDNARQPGDFIQTDAAINPGNSGGALVNAHGQLVGINVGIITDSGSFAGAGFAIPAATAQSVAEQIIKTGAVHHGYLGISMNDVTPENAHFFNLSNADGAIVTQVTPDSPASRADLRNGDVIERLNGKAMLNGGNPAGCNLRGHARNQGAARHPARRQATDSRSYGWRVPEGWRGRGEWRGE